jgi:hypothetical protein
MQQLLQLKTEEPQDSVSTDSLFKLDPFNENFEQFTELRDLSSTLFKSSFLLELKEETKSLDITLDEEKKKLILKLKKKTKSKSLAKKGQFYALKKELKIASLTLVYNLLPEYDIMNELQPITPIETMNVVKPLEVAQPKTLMSDLPKLSMKLPILINNPDNITIVLPIPKYTENLSQELAKISYEEKFNPFATKDTFSEVETSLDTDNHPLKIVRPEDLIQQYRPDLIVQTTTQNFEGQLERVQIIRHNKPRFENGEFIYQEIRMSAAGSTTVYDLIRNSGLPIRAKYSSRFDGVYVESLNGAAESNTFWEYKINGQYGTTTVDKAIVKPGDEVTWVLKTANSSVCGEPVAG